MEQENELIELSGTIENIIYKIPIRVHIDVIICVIL